MKTGNSGAGTLPGALTGFAGTGTGFGDNNSILQNTSTVSMNCAASDGNVIACTSSNTFNASDFSLAWSDLWGPDGAANEGWDVTDMGWPNYNFPLQGMMYLPQYSRPWKVFRYDSSSTPDTLNAGWFDAESINYSATRTALNAPQFAKCTDEPFATLDAAYIADNLERPAFIQSGFGQNFLQYKQGSNISGDVLGTRGWWMVMRTDISRTKDYLVFQPP